MKTKRHLLKPSETKSRHIYGNSGSVRSDVGLRAHRHSLAVRSTHWIFAVAFFLLVFSSLPILIAHPRFYWGETGAIGTPPLFVLPLPLWVGRSGWGRSLHFLAAWIALFAGIIYVASGVISGYLLRHVVPTRNDLTWRALRSTIAAHLSRNRSELQSSFRYNPLQRIAYILVVFLLFPLILLTGLAMSPAITSVAPWLVEMFGGHQSARTLHFAFSQFLAAFFVVHVVMVARAGFVSRTLGMVMTDIPERDVSPSAEACTSTSAERIANV